MEAETISLSDLREIVFYDPKTGHFEWRKSRGGKALAGTKAGSVNRRGYIEISIRCRKWLGHRLAWFYTHGQLPKAIDHINGNASDNRIDNLRAASQGQNMANTRIRRNNTSGFKGVSWCSYTNRWVAHIRKDGRKRTVGRFDTPEEAHAAYCLAAEQMHGEFARHG